MNVDHVTLGRLAIAGLLFRSLTPYNTSLSKLRDATGNRVDLSINQHCNAVVRWLNDWGCRHLSEDYHDTAADSILAWYKAASARLLEEDKPLWQADHGELFAASSAYASLKGKLGAWRVRDGGIRKVRIGQTAASKILFAIRPRALMPWDDAMRTALKREHSLRTYLDYLLSMRDLTLHVDNLCRNHGFGIEDLPHRLGRPESTVIELINEYTWVTVPRKVGRRIDLPSSETLAQWAALG